jgi:hypothetical protein
MLNQIKRLVFEKAMTAGEVGVQIDVGAPGVQIPDHIDKSKPVTFVYGFNQPRPITDLKVDEEGIRATLVFGVEWLLTFVPWTSVVAITGERLGLVIFLAGQVVAERPEPERPARGLRLVPDCASDR